MPHGGYHGTIKVGDTVVQTGGGAYTPGGINTSSAPSAAEATAAAEAKKKEIQNIFGNQPVDFEQGFVSTGDDDAKARAQRINFQNQQLNNLLIQQAQAEARDRILGGASIPSVDVEQGFGNTGVLRKADLTGFEGGPFGLNIPALGATPSIGMSGINTLRNPLTGELLFSTDPKNLGSRQDELLKAREGLTTPQYNEFIANLYDANPELFEEQFPVASGQALKPLIARILEGDLGKLAGNIGSGIGSFIDSATGAMFKPRGGTVTAGNVDTSSDTGGETAQAVPEGMDMSIYGSFIGKPGPFIANFVDQDGDGVDDRFQSGPGQPSNIPTGMKKDPPPTSSPVPMETGITPFNINQFYASLPQYTQQGIMAPTNLSRFTDALRMFPGATV